MPVRKSFVFLVLFAFSWSALSAQTVDKEAAALKKERQLKLLEQILADAQNLRLPENRALVLARVGHSLWPADEKTARRLFQEAIADLVDAQTAVHQERAGKPYFQPLIYGQAPRLDVINLIAARDAALALDYFAKSRPPAIAEALQNPAVDDGSLSRQYARAEIGFEQRLLGLAAEQNPQIAAARIRESLKKGVSYETLNLLKKVYSKEPAIAAKLAEEVVEGLLKIDFSKNYQDLDAVAYLIGDFGRVPEKDEKALRIPDELLRRLILKMTADWLAPGNSQAYGFWNSMPVIERLLPERAAEVKRKIDRLASQSPEESREYNKLVSANPTPEEMIARAEKFSASYRNQLYRAAADKFAEKGNVAEADKILRSGISDGQSEYYLSQFYLNLSAQMSAQGKFAEAQNHINQIPDEFQRATALVQLATSAYNKDPKENQKLAEAILDQSRALLPPTPETGNDLTVIGYLAIAYAPFAADAAFDLLESIRPAFNEVNQANFVLMKFRNYGGVRQGEFQISGGTGNLGVYNLEPALNQLKDKDFERARQFADGIERPETRIWFLMQLIDDNAAIGDLPVTGRYFGKIDG